MAQDLNNVYASLAKVLKRNSAGLYATAELPNSQAKMKKKQIFYYTKKKASINGKPPAPVYFSGLIAQKGYVGFYFMAHYVKPKEFSPAMKKALKGKSCFHVKTADASVLKEIDAMLKKGKAVYKANGWL